MDDRSDRGDGRHHLGLVLVGWWPPMSFRDGSFRQRFSEMGDTAEKVFEDTYHEGFARYGLNRPPINMSKLPAIIRYSPDYLTGKSLVEVQGFGTDQTAKFKTEKLRAMSQWHAEFRVDWFLYDSYHKRYGWVRHPELLMVCKAKYLSETPEGKPWFLVPAIELPVVDGWIEHTQA